LTFFINKKRRENKKTLKTLFYFKIKKVKMVSMSGRLVADESTSDNCSGGWL